MCVGRPIESHELNFWDKILVPAEPDGCWEWTGTRDSAGYGEFAVNNKTIRRKARAHRWVLDFCGEHDIASRDDNIHHVCENKLCVNPEHLEVMSRADHTRTHHSLRKGERDV